MPERNVLLVWAIQASLFLDVSDCGRPWQAFDFPVEAGMKAVIRKA